MVGQDVVRVLSRPAFHDLVLTSSGDLGYLGPQWRRDIGCAGSDVPMQVALSLPVYSSSNIDIKFVQLHLRSRLGLHNISMRICQVLQPGQA